MIVCMTGGKPFPSEVIQQLLAKTDGVPLFVEELTKMVLESGLAKESRGRYELTGPHCLSRSVFLAGGGLRRHTR